MASIFRRRNSTTGSPSSEESPTSSQVTIPMFKEAFKEFVEQDIPVLAILISDRLSGTISSATQAKAMFPGCKD